MLQKIAAFAERFSPEDLPAYIDEFALVHSNTKKHMRYTCGLPPKPVNSDACGQHVRRDFDPTNGLKEKARSNFAVFIVRFAL